MARERATANRRERHMVLLAAGDIALAASFAALIRKDAAEWKAIIAATGSRSNSATPGQRERQDKTCAWPKLSVHAIKSRLCDDDPITARFRPLCRFKPDIPELRERPQANPIADRSHTFTHVGVLFGLSHSLR